MPMRGELPIAVARPYGRAPAVQQTAGSRFLAAISNPDLHCIVGFCGIGLLTAINMILWFPDFGATVAAFAMFP